MAKLFFPNGAISSVTSVSVSTKIRADIGHGNISSKSIFSVGSLERICNSFAITSIITASLKGTLKRRLKLSRGAIASTSSVSILEFVAESQSAPPTASLQVGNSAFARSRFVRGDLIPVNFMITGQRLAGLKGIFTAKVKNSLTISPLIIMNIGSSTPIVNPQTEIENSNGNFLIESADTATLPDGETEFGYNFKLQDGNGRIYTVEVGSFTVYSV